MKAAKEENNQGKVESNTTLNFIYKRAIWIIIGISILIFALIFINFSAKEDADGAPTLIGNLSDADINLKYDNFSVCNRNYQFRYV